MGANIYLKKTKRNHCRVISIYRLANIYAAGNRPPAALNLANTRSLLSELSKTTQIFRSAWTAGQRIAFMSV